MKKVFVQSITFISIEAEEALLQLTDGTYTCIAFSQPCTKLTGDIISEILYSFNTTALMLDKIDRNSYITTKSNNLEHEVSGIVSNVENNILVVGLFVIETDIHMPGGIQVGDYVKFTCSRLDLF